MDNKLRTKILNENINEHRKEAKYYDEIHSEIFNKYEQNRINNSLSKITNNLGKTIRILEVGPGTGNITSKLINRGFRNITCVDISEEMLAMLKSKVNLDEHRIIASDIDSYLDENKDHKYDLIILSSVLHHLPDYVSTFKNLLGHLSSGGILYITHEPCKRNVPKNVFIKCYIKLLRTVDYLVSLFRYIMRITSGIKLHRNCEFSDYHTGENVISLDFLKRTINKGEYQFTINKYSTANLAILAKLLSKVEKKSFELIVYKNELDKE